MSVGLRGVWVCGVVVEAGMPLSPAVPVGELQRAFHLRFASHACDSVPSYMRAMGRGRGRARLECSPRAISRGGSRVGVVGRGEVRGHLKRST